MELNVRKFALASGITWGLGMFLCGILSTALDWTEIVSLMATAYKGYDGTFVGSLIGAMWGFADGLIGGGALAWIYNKL